MSATTSPNPSLPAAKSTLGKYVSRMREALKSPTSQRRPSPGLTSPSLNSSGYATGAANTSHLPWSRSADRCAYQTSRSTPPTTIPRTSSPVLDLELDHGATSSAHEEDEEGDCGRRAVIHLTTRANLDFDRLRLIAAKWDLCLETECNDPHEPSDRVTKPIRMRVHRTCHRCDAMFGSSRTCPKCEHVRCTKCPRNPTIQTHAGYELDHKTPRSTPVSRPRSSILISSGGLVVDDGPDDEEVESLKRKYRYMLSLPPRAEGRELVRKKPMQRVRRTCHLCTTVYMPGNRTCIKCGHLRCSACPRDPAKRHKYPEGYPGDIPGDSSSRPCTANSSESSFFTPSVPQMGTMLPGPNRIFKKPSRQIRYTCHGCRTVFQSTETLCQGCGHEKCPECPRAPLRMSKSKSTDSGFRVPDTPKNAKEAEVVEGVQERLRSLGVASSFDGREDRLMDE